MQRISKQDHSTTVGEDFSDVLIFFPDTNQNKAEFIFFNPFLPRVSIGVLYSTLLVIYVL
jgi:hypothetical protein